MLRILKAVVEADRLRAYFPLESITTADELTFLLSVLEGADNDVSKVPAVGLLGSVLARKEHSLEENEKVWETLIGLCAA